MSKYSITVDGLIKIYIDGTLHLAIKTDILVGFQSWVNPGIYCIEYTTTCGSILCEYDRIDKWKAILNLLDKNIGYLP